MAHWVVYASALVSFLIVILGTPYFIKYLRKIGLVVMDMNKKNKSLIPISGGLIVLAGIISGVMFFIFMRVFIFKSRGGLVLYDGSLAVLFAALISITFVAIIGFIDDLVIKSNQKESMGLKQWQKPLLTFVAAVPLMVISAGHHTMWIPFMGNVNFGWIYPLILIPLGVVGASNMVNMYAGFNGLESGLGVIYIGSLGLYAYVNNSYEVAFLALMIFSAIIGFWFFNKYPAKIFPGDSLTYLLGCSLAVLAIVGNLEKAALILSIPFFVEFVLKLRGRFKKQSYGYYADGKVKSFYSKVYSIPHFFTRTGRFTEKQVVYFCFVIHLIFAGLIWII